MNSRVSSIFASALFLASSFVMMGCGSRSFVAVEREGDPTYSESKRRLLSLTPEGVKPKQLSSECLVFFDDSESDGFVRFMVLRPDGVLNGVTHFVGDGKLSQGQLREMFFSEYVEICSPARVWVGVHWLVSGLAKSDKGFRASLKIKSVRSTPMLVGRREYWVEEEAGLYSDHQKSFEGSILKVVAHGSERVYRFRFLFDLPLEAWRYEVSEK